jgi:hypothetical protein
MSRRNSVFVRTRCGETVHVNEGDTLKEVIKNHNLHCFKCSPPPPPPKLVRQHAERIIKDPLSPEKMEMSYTDDTSHTLF